jgi:hypothetical protein
MDGGGEHITSPIAATLPYITFAIEYPIDDAVLAGWTRESNVAVSYQLSNTTTKASMAVGQKSISWTTLVLSLVLILITV